MNEMKIPFNNDTPTDFNIAAAIGLSPERWKELWSGIIEAIQQHNSTANRTEAVVLLASECNTAAEVFFVGFMLGQCVERPSLDSYKENVTISDFNGIQ